MKNRQGVRFRITATTTACFLVGMLAILLTLFLYLRSAFGQLTENAVREQGEKYANMIQNQFERPVSFLSGVSSMVEEQMETGHVDRVALQQFLFHAFEKYPISEGTAFMLEPNVYDGLDSRYAGTDYGTKRNGRISYYYYREGGRTQYLPQTEDDEQEFVQPYYTEAKARKAPMFSEPYLYTVGGRTAYMITASYPLMDAAGQVLGVMTVDLYLDSIHEALSQEKVYDTGYITVISEGGRLLYGPKLDEVGETAESVGHIYERPAAGEEVRYSRVTSAVNGKPSLAATIPVTLDTADSRFYVTLVAPEGEVNAVHERLLLLMVGLTVLVCLAIVLVLRVVTGRIVHPMNRMMTFLKRVGETGDLTFADEEWKEVENMARSPDEVGRSFAAFRDMMEHLSACGRTLQAVAQRDLAIEVEKLGEQDTIGTALGEMVEKLNGMFDEINDSAGQVASGSQQIADGAQMLAQGADEQNTAIERLSVSISEMSGSIEDAVSYARDAAQMTGVIRAKAEEGSERMRAMVDAVREINDASQNISKVIRVIDDIAFQTNILALNAAVEAARAGQHGKGFAVVAEEVRNLAAKSAEAAKDTEELIENSIAKADLGVRIAGETNESLREIVDSIVASNRIIGEIAARADQQSAAVEDLQLGIDQVTLVVQQNNATAGESAAAAEELSGQSETLSGLVSQFHLRRNPARLTEHSL
ncbi:MAG: methyl-accepting chemotaxis protein [Oscillospiraceae bacterium]|jgi:methyl-accepting chemotaxis protein|nr:methyl-accepting chemotaxis protein [Oscillospiraceae bacterium]